MTPTIEQTDEAIRNTFYSMEESVEYILNDYWFSEINRLRKEHNYSPLKDKREYKLSRKGDHLFLNGRFMFDFDGKDNIAFALSVAFAVVAISCANALNLTLALASFALALQHNGIEKLKADTCDGKVVEIDGKKYKLTAV